MNVHQGGYATPDEGQPDFRTSFGDALAGQTALEGYPSGTINRHLFSDLTTGGGTALNRGDWAAAANRIFAEPSYANVGMTTVYNPITREVTITVETYYVENLPFGVNSNFLQVAILESGIIAYQAGASSNYNHKHMLRHLVTGQWGDEITGITAGTTVSRTYTYTVNDNWVAENCTVLVSLTETKQEIITGAEVPLIDGLHNGEIEADFARIFADNTLEAGVSGTNSEFDLTIINGNAAEQNFELVLSHDAPADWVVNFSVDGIVYTSTTNLVLAGDVVQAVKINVTPGPTVGVAHCELTLTSTDFPAAGEKVAEVFVVSGVENLIVNGSGSGSGISSYSYESNYKTALTNAGCQTFGAIPGYNLEQAYSLGVLDGVKNIFFNIGGTTPVLNLAQTNLLQSFINDGGNLFIAGQDIGRDIFASGGTSSSITQKLFFQNYISASYLNDGTSANISISPANDSIFSGMETASLSDVYSGQFDPDEVKKFGTSVEIFYYPNGKAAGLRNYKGSSRIIYLAFGLEQVSSLAVRNDIIDRSYRWFEGWEGSDIKQNSSANLKVFPNPCSDILSVSYDEKTSAELTILSITGQIVKTVQINSDSKIDISDLNSGIYFVEIKTDKATYKEKITKL
jgi:hypothetical protein